MCEVQSLARQFEEYLLGALPTSDNPVYAPFRYIMELPAKRLRPMLLLLSYKLFREFAEPAFPLALSIELFHNFTLMHDDIMDDADLRRGQPSVHAAYSLNDAILSGDIMMLHSIQLLEHIEGSGRKDRIRKAFTNTAIAICEGQRMDMDFENRISVGLPEYLQMIELKTAILLGLSMWIGGLAAGSDDEQAEGLYQIGVNSGMAFQLMDDILDLYGDESKFGKKRGGDVVQNKKTVLYILAMNSLSEDRKLELENLYSTSNPVDTERKVELVESLFNRSNVKSQAESLMDEYQLKASKAWDLLPSGEGKSRLIDFMAKLFSRIY